MTNVAVIFLLTFNVT